MHCYERDITEQFPDVADPSTGDHTEGQSEVAASIIILPGQPCDIRAIV